MRLYIHIPFCHRVCPYCSFYKHTPGATSIGRFVDALLAEAHHRIGTLASASPGASTPKSLYFGGGTPSMLSPSHLKKLLRGLAELIEFDSLDDITLEANPATFDVEKARLFRALGVRRVSLGIQSFHSPTLQTLGREHSPAQAAESVRVLRQAEIPSLNIDLMFSIPGLDLACWRHTLESAIHLQPDHISAYNLTYEEDTAFFESLQSGSLHADPDRDADQFLLAEELLTAAGFDHYETSNYAKPGHHSAHNRGYWRGEDYLGLGPSAVSTLDSIRTTNIADTERYVKMVEKIGHATHRLESLTAEQLRLERIALLLRTSEGVPLNLLEPATVQMLVDSTLAEICGGRLILTAQGRPLVDSIAAELA